MKTLKMPVYHDYVKGRFKRRDREWSIYDGLR